MSLRIRRVQIRAATAVGTVGADLEFNDGLNVVAAPNTSGKSTCMMSMLYALGLEGMLGPSHQPPLADAVQTSITIDKEEVSVVGSQVRLEIENHLHEFLTVQRAIAGPNIDRHLIRCVIRIIWSYLIAMLEVDRKYQSNHLGLLIFDEPRQQGAEQVSFDELMRRAAESIKSGQQVIVATSESKNLLEPILKELTCAYRYIPFEGKIIQRIDLAPPSAKDQPSSF